MFKINLQKLKDIVVVIIFALLLFYITSSVIEIYASNKEPVCVPIIMYHQVKYGGYGKDVISPDEFKSDLEFLSKNNYTTIIMADLIDYVYNDKPLPDKPIIISFDDGLLSTYINVFPLLQEYNMKIVLSVIGIGADNFSKAPSNNINYAHATWDQLKEMKDSGLVELQNHSHNMHKSCDGRVGCRQLPSETIENYEKILTEDLLKCQDLIISMTESSPNTFTYPYGAYSESTSIVIEKLGFKASLSCKFGVNLITDDPRTLFNLKRICRSHNEGVAKLIEDGMETLKFLQD